MSEKKVDEKDSVKEEKKRRLGIIKISIKLDRENIRLFTVLFILLFLFLFFNSFFGIFEKRICGDETPYGECSSNLPYFCMKGKLIQDASVCGCPANSSQRGDFCEYPYQVDTKNSSRVIALTYFLNGKKSQIDFLLYDSLKESIDEKPLSIVSYGNEDIPSLIDFKLRSINEPEQKSALIPLVIKIQNLAKDKEDQARIAISLVQNIPYDKSKGLSLNSKYPYDVLYDNKGLCGSKSELLAFLLREIGYEVAIFHYYWENHEAVGIKCPKKYSFNNSGYCFVESTQPAILSYSNGYYSEQGRLSSTPEIIFISNGTSLGNNLKEYEDARTFDVLFQSLEKHGGAMSTIEAMKYEQFFNKYGIIFLFLNFILE